MTTKDSLVALKPGPGRVSLFPTENGPGVLLSQDELRRLSPHFSTLYRALIDATASRLVKRFSIGAPTANVLARRALVPIAHCFLERAIRIDRLVRKHGASELSVAAAASVQPSPLIEQFQSRASSSVSFNAAVLARAARAWGLRENRSIPADDDAPAPSNLASFFNHNFTYRQPGIAALAQKAWAKLVAKPLSRHFGRVPALSMAYSTSALKARSFYFRLLSELPYQWTPATPPADAVLREDCVASAVSAAQPALTRFMTEAGFDRALWPQLGAAFTAFLQDLYPSALLEGIPDNMRRGLELLSRHRGGALLFASAGSTSDAFTLAAARELGMTIVGCQHGGHYGYIDDFVDPEELEYAFCDVFVSWGWTKLSDNPSCRGVHVMPLPDPWLSERRNYWARMLPATAFFADKPFDLLLMTNKVYRFTPAPAGAMLSRADLIEDFSAGLKALVSEATKRRVRVLHKPYNADTRVQLRATLEELKRLGGDCYQEREPLDKGLSPELLSQCRIVVWDQPGTGFLECLVSKIPTLVFWPRAYNREAPWAAEAFASLEYAGIVHRSAEGLCAQAKSFAADPASWMQDPARLAAVSAFCRAYAWTDDRWASRWREYLASLKRP